MDFQAIQTNERESSLGYGGCMINHTMMEPLDYQGSVTDESVFSELASLAQARTALQDPDLTQNFLEGVEIGHVPLREGKTQFRAIQQQGYNSDNIRVATRLFLMNGRNCANERMIPLPKDLKEVASLLGADTLEQEEMVLEGIRTIVSGTRVDDLHLFVKAGSSLYCLKVKGNTSPQSIIEQVQQFRIEQSPRGRALYFPFDATPKRKPSATAKPVCLLYNDQPLRSNIMDLPRFSLLVTALNVILEWRISHRFALFCDKRYFLSCRTVEPLPEVKQQFLQVYGQVESTTCLCPEAVWFTQDNKVITDKLLRKTFHSIVTRALEEGDMTMTPEDKSLLVLLPDHSYPDKAYIEVFVHFQPANALCVELQLKDENKSQDGPVVVLPPQASEKDVRDEVSKVVRKEAISLRISIGPLKLDSVVDLEKDLSLPGSKIYVSPKKKMTLSVSVVKCPSPNDGRQVLQVSVYSYDFVETMKRDLSWRLQVPLYQVEIFLHGQSLIYSKTFSENRIRNRDFLEAKVYVNRLEMSVRMPNGRKYKILVDDCLSFTVRCVKAFARTLGEVESFHDCEVSAIVKDYVVSDDDILGEILGEPPILLLVRVENVCFTSVYPGKMVVIHSNSDGTVNQHVLAMSDGETVFHGQNLQRLDDELTDLIVKRRQAVGPRSSVPGIQVKLEDVFDNLRGRPVNNSLGSSPANSVSSVSTNPGYNRATPSTVPPEVKVTHQQITSTPTKGCLARKSTSVRFTLGSSASELGDLQADVCQSNQSFEETLISRSEANTLTKNEEDNESSSTQTGSTVRIRQRSRSGDGKNKATDPAVDPNRTCQSAPPSSIYETNNILATRVQRSDSDSAVMRRITLENCVQDPDGTYTYRQDTSSEIRGLTLAMAKDTMLSRPCMAATYSPARRDSRSLTPLQTLDEQSQTPVSMDPAYIHVKERVVRAIAQQLGPGYMIIRALNVTDPIIAQAKTEHPHDLAERNMFLLRYWCTSCGSKATKEVLKKTLAENGRMDLAELVDTLDPDVVPPNDPGPAGSTST